MAIMRRLIILPMAASVAVVLSIGGAAAVERAGRAEIMVAQLTGPDRESFVQSSIASCTSTVQQNHADFPADTIKAYCTCMADKEADMTTPADLAYMGEHHAASTEYAQRVTQLAVSCNAAAGLH